MADDTAAGGHGTRTAGAVGGMFISLIVGAILQSTKSYVPIFIMASSMYLIALLVIHLLVPRLEPAKVPAAAAEGR